MSNEHHFDVIVVGYGPTGLTLASLLGQRGHRVAVVERWPQLYGKPRLTHIDGETARLISLAADSHEALRDSWTTPHYNWVNGKGDLLFDVAAGNTRKMLWDDHISVHQPHIEEAIHSRISQLKNVRLFRGYLATSLHQNETRVALECAPWNRAEDGTAIQGEPITLHARYLVGADGSKSRIREVLGIERQDFGFNERWLCVDTEPLQPLPEKFNENAVQVCDPRRGYMFMPIGRRRQRFEFALLPNETTEDMSREDAAWKLLHTYHALGPNDLKLVRNLVYTFECRLATRWRVGRVFLAGDAAHTNPPYLGQGACSGMRDASNLAWKIDLVLRRQASDELLDTYYQERMPHARQLMLDSRSLGLVANTANPVKAFVRDFALRFKLVPTPKWPTLQDGFLARTQQGKLALDVGSVPSQGHVEIAGCRQRFDEAVGYGFTVLSRRDPWPQLSTAVRTAVENWPLKLLCIDSPASGSPAIQFRDTDQVYTQLFDKWQTDTVVLRPDFVLYGYASAAATPSFLQSLIDQVASTQPLSA